MWLQRMSKFDVSVESYSYFYVLRTVCHDIEKEIISILVEELIPLVIKITILCGE
jgi:hypothetical protein